MNLSAIYIESVGILSHAERDYYLAFCSFADNHTGQCHPKLKTVAERAGMSPQSASRMYRKLINHGFIEKVSGGHKCVIGYDKTKHSVKFSKPDVNFSEPKTTHEVNFSPVTLEAEIEKSSPDVNSTKHDVKSHIKEGTTHKTSKKEKHKEADSPELVSFRKTLSAYQKEYAEPTTKGKAIANLNAIKKLFELARGDTRICIDAHLFFQSEGWRNGRVDWVTVHTNFTSYQAVLRNGTTNRHQQQTRATSVDRLHEHRAIADQYLTEAELGSIA